MGDLHSKFHILTYIHCIEVNDCKIYRPIVRQIISSYSSYDSLAGGAGFGVLCDPLGVGLGLQV